ncbi:MAG TPA: helix-turn-helix domain-containing protein [Streptosporangiaceae bacterium]|nr:helix-turn-helix domain-containing protein [Streptosporangiaceae bacterium]
MNDSTLGSRLREVRRERGLTQEELADAAGVSSDLIGKLEQGRRTSARITSLTYIANALDIGLSELLGKRERLDRRDDGGVLAVRDTLLAVGDLPGIDPADDDGEPTPASELEAAVQRGWDLYWAGNLGELASRLPGLIGEARITEQAAVTGEHRSAAAAVLAQAYQLAADLMVHVGNDDLAAISAERGLAAAARGSDELQHATIAGTAAWVMMHQARPAAAEQVAATAAGQVEPVLSNAAPEHLTVWGGLLLWAAAAAAAGSRPDETAEYIGVARAAATRFGADRHDYQTNFGPTQVEMQACHTSAVLGQPGSALRAARAVRRSDLRRISWGAHQLDVAQACLDSRRILQAVDALTEARDVSAEWFRHQGMARAMVGDVVEQQRRLTPRVRSLAATVGIK